MARRFNRKVLALDIEETYGVDATPDGADAVLIYDAEYDQEFTYTSAKRALPYLARARQDTATLFGRLKGWVELAGSGTAGTAPAWGKILRACSWAETVTEDTDVAYTPVSTADESASFIWNMDGQLHKLLGARGMITGINFPPNDLPRLMFEMVGIPQAPSETAAVVPDFSAWKPAIVVNKANTPTFTLHGFAAVLRSLEINMGTVLALRDLVNANDVLATDREPAFTVVIEDPLLASKNFYALAKANTLGAMQLVHGTVAGNKVQIDAPKAQVTSPKKTNVENVAYLSMSGGLDPDEGNDEIVITAK